MGIWDFIGSTAETVKTYVPVPVPDATPLKNACRASYGLGLTAATKVGQMGQWIAEDENKSKIWLYSTKFAKNAGLYTLQEGYKLIPGGVAFSKIVSQTVKDVKHENLRDEKLIKGSEEKLLTPKLHSSDRARQESIERVEMVSRVGAKSAAMNRCGVESLVERAPEDVIRVFMMKEFIGNRFLDDLMVPKFTGRKKPE